MDFECLGAWKTPMGVVIKWDYTIDQGKNAKWHEGYIIVPDCVFKKHKGILERIEKQEITTGDKWTLANYVNQVFKRKDEDERLLAHVFDVRDKRKELEGISQKLFEARRSKK